MAMDKASCPRHFWDSQATPNVTATSGSDGSAPITVVVPPLVREPDAVDVTSLASRSGRWE